MSTYRVTYTPHATCSQVREQIESGEGIDNAAALAIASWWQASAGDGYPFAILASTGTVVANDLRDSIRSALLEASDDESREELDALSSWLDAVTA